MERKPCCMTNPDERLNLLEELLMKEGLYDVLQILGKRGIGFTVNTMPGGDPRIPPIYTPLNLPEIFPEKKGYIVAEAYQPGGVP